MDVENKDPELEDQPAPKKPGRLRRGARALTVIAIWIVVLGFGVLIGGFFRFSSEITSVTPPADIAEADGIVVLTGRSHRIEQALDLLDQGLADRLLISGVYPSTTAEQIRKLTSTEAALFECCVDIGHDALDTEGNALEVSQWARDNNFTRVIVVTSSDHMPRSLIELRRLDEEVEFIPYPVVPDEFRNYDWVRRPALWRPLVEEYAKYLIARLRLATGTDVAGEFLRSVAHAAGRPTAGGIDSQATVTD
ncbi:ElyC/SanA/YdcF family protein [Hoeflea sp. CAU 1731]